MSAVEEAGEIAQQYVGTVGIPVTKVIEAGAIKAFVQATGNPGLVYVDKEFAQVKISSSFIKIFFLI